MALPQSACTVLLVQRPEKLCDYLRKSLQLLFAGLGLLNGQPNEPEHGNSRDEVRDGLERQTSVYDIHGEEQVQSWVKVDKRTASPTAFVTRGDPPRYSELARWLLVR